MVLFKNRWCKKFIKSLANAKDTDFWARYRRRIPSNINAEDVANVADTATIKKCMTRPSANFVPKDYESLAPLDVRDGYRFHENINQPGYVTYHIERSGILYKYRSDDLKDVFTIYIKFIFGQLR